MNEHPFQTGRITSSLNTNNKLVVKNHGPVYVYQAIGYNGNAALRYLKIYDDPNATIGTTVPRMTIPLPPTAAFAIPIGGIMKPLKLLTGLTIALVTGADDSDNTAVGAGEILGLNVLYR